MPFLEGNSLGGRPKGVQNKITQQAKELFYGIMSGEMENIQDSLKQLRSESHKDYLNVLSKLMPYVMPKMVDITSDGKKLGLDLAKEQYKSED